MNKFAFLRQLTLSTLLVGATNALHAQDAPSEEALGFFRQNCKSCHTIGGGALTGPDLKGAHERQSDDWLVKFMLDPKGVIDGGDPYAVELLRKARGVYMNKTPGLDADLARKLVNLIRAESAKERSEFAGLQISDRALTPADVERGRRLFLGKAAYANGAPACVSCHSVSGIGGLGGGRLGPDLTDVYDRLEGRNSLSAWLGAPPSAVMQPVYKQHPLEGEEVLALVAYLKHTAESEETGAAPSALRFLLAGFGGSVFLLLLFDFLWRKRYRATRRPLIRKRRNVAPLGSHS